MVSKKVVVIGGGVAGIRAALNLARMGASVLIVEKGPNLGGNVINLDRVFPSNDCAMCSLLPDLRAVDSHKMIKVLTLSDVIGVEGEHGNFSVKVLTRPSFVNENCVSCGECAMKCPSKVPSTHDHGLSVRKSIHRPFPNAVPVKYLIDKENCIYFKMLAKGKPNRCMVCKKRCSKGAVDFDMKAKEETFPADIIIVATGFEPIFSIPAGDLGFDRFENVISSMEFERHLNPSGPTGGDVLRPSDRQSPKNIVFVQCTRTDAGAKEALRSSTIGRMNALVEARTLLREIEGIESIVMFKPQWPQKDLAPWSKMVAELDINVIPGSPSAIEEDPDSKDLTVKVDGVAGREEVKANLVVLAPAMGPGTSTKELAQTLGIDIDVSGFILNPEIRERSHETTRKGIYVCGSAQGPGDILDANTDASGVAALIGPQLGLKSKVPGPTRPRLRDLCGLCYETRGIKTSIPIVPSPLENGIAQVEDWLCIGCSLCSRICPYQAIKMISGDLRVNEGEREVSLATVIEKDCTGCGKCVANCPTGALSLTTSGDEKVLEKLLGALE